MWTLDTSNGFESDKIAALVVPYTQGRGVDIGCGQRKVWPSAIGIDSCKDYGGQRPASVDIIGEGDALKLFQNETLDYVFSSHLVEHFHEKDVAGILDEWARVLKPGGYLVLYVPSSNFYPKVGSAGSNPDHKWDIYPGDIEKKLLATPGHRWVQVECEERSEGNEYSLFEVYRKETDQPVHSDGEPTPTLIRQELWQRNPDGKKRALVIRYGAIGDALMTASIFPELQKQGYYVTLNCAPKTEEILRHDPHINEFFVQGVDFVPNQSLGPYWETLAATGRYDKIINLCESVEGALLALPGRLNHQYPTAARQKFYGTVNYMERHHDIAGVPYTFHQKFYPTPAELAEAKALKATLAGAAPVVVWAINGSSPHKVYPWVNVVCAWLAKQTPAHIILLADGGIGFQLQVAIMQTMETDGCDMSRVHGYAGKLEIRQALALAQVADLVIGPETGISNSVAMEAIPKVIYLSHSSHENLTKHWINTTVLVPDTDKAPCWPCHQLHHDWKYCPQNKETGAALCASSIAPETVFKAVVAGLLATEPVKEKAA